jgi:hypothetical protein
MGSTSAKLKDPKAISDFLHEASIRLGISKDRLTTAVRAAQTLSKAELEVMIALAELARAGTPLKKRKAVSRAILNVLKTVYESGDNPLAEGDEPIRTAAAVSALLLSEIEIQTGHRYMP